MQGNILLVDDDEETLTAFGALLRRLGCAVQTANSLDEACGALRGAAFDIVITDLRLSGAGGEEGADILRFIRSHTPATPVILMTGYGSPSVMTKIYELGAAFYLEKPVHPRAITRALETLL